MSMRTSITLMLAGVGLATTLIATSGAEARQQPPLDGLAIVPVAPAPCDGCWGVINSNGTVRRDKGVVASSRLGVGIYDVRFSASIARCVWILTQGDGVFANVPPPGEIVVTGRAGTTNGLFIQTFNSAGVLTDRNFHALVKC